MKCNDPPLTSNPEAAALIRRAQERCTGCRLSWRMEHFTHYRTVNGKRETWLQCNAPTERQALRDIVARRHAK